MDIDISIVLMTLVNFFILVLILKHFFWEKIQLTIEERQNYVDEKLIKADEDSQKAKMYLLENQRILQSAKEEGKKITEKQKEKGNKIYQEIIDNANEEAKSLLERAKVEIQREKEKAEYEVKKQAVDLAVQLSIKALEENMDESKHRQLIGDFITKVGM
ncbi:F0F1 ATP synthase subunit B [Clostridium uliginosum]|uniref:ATP synthase subunit b n=1 Tax=Clostridium uliginosum TaxID=119641 RepID=A0A1I1IAC1_9CLOT|nr:F0F1 ATP synthase subunit B [Clostridium uliginosum]SFC32995.1 F-type H+-transporting ATPase subunit b [Clostridium uliginosum]